MEKKNEFSNWISHVSEDEKKILRQLDSQEMKEAFEGDLSFGTAGVRAKMGLGPSLLNEYTVALISKAVCKNIKAKKITISFDTRQNSLKFASIAASIFANEGINVIFADSMPTPFLSFLVRYYRCDAGIMITASHNTKEYNGYKVYDSTGCQILPKLAENIANTIDDLDCFSITYPSFKEMEKTGLITSFDEKALEYFYSEIESICPQEIEKIVVVYSALNGTGANLVPQLLVKNNVKVVLNKVQCAPDPEFSTCPSPNPENEQVFVFSRTLGLNSGADLILCTDPDCDRLGVEVLHCGKYTHLSGNELGIILTYFLASKKKKGYIMRSLVSTPLADKIAQKYNIETKVCLTGFKYIGEFLNELEKEHKADRFVLGFEESCGYLAGNYARDKDAAVASLLICKCASECKKRGLTLVDLLNEIYDEFGHYNHKTLAIKTRNTEMNMAIMNALRTDKLNYLGGLRIEKMTDYLFEETNLPRANMIQFDLEGNSSIIFRPSGTEPVLKAYITTVSPTTDSLDLLQYNITQFIQSIKK